MKKLLLLLILSVSTTEIFGQIHISMFGNIEKHIDSVEYNFKDYKYDNYIFGNNTLKVVTDKNGKNAYVIYNYRHTY